MFAIISNLVLIALAIVGLCLPFAGLSMLRCRARIRSTPVRSAGMLDEGWSAVQGRAVALEPMTAPFSGRPCAYYEADVQELAGGTHRKSIRYWSTLATLRSNAPFWIEDGSGRVLVSTRQDDANLDLSDDFEFRNASDVTGHLTCEVPPTVLAAMDALDIPHVDEERGLKALRIVERTIEADAEVYATGRHTGDTVAVADAGGDGAARSVLTCDGKNPVYVARGTAAEAPGPLLWKGVACIAGGPALTAAAVGFLYLVYFIV